MRPRTTLLLCAIAALMAGVQVARAQPAEPAPPPPAAVDEAVFDIYKKGAKAGGETMTVVRRDAASAAYRASVTYGKKTAFTVDLVTGPNSALTSIALKGRFDDDTLDSSIYVVDDKAHVAATRNGKQANATVMVPILAMAFDGNAAVYWQSLADGLHTEGPWERNALAPQVGRNLTFTVKRKKTAARVTHEGRARPVSLYEVKGFEKTGRMYVAEDGKVVLVEISPDGLVMKRKGWQVGK